MPPLDLGESDERAIALLTEVAKEFEAKAREAEEADRTDDYPGDDAVAASGRP